MAKLVGNGGLASMPCIVCDNGTGFVKVGYAGQNFPACSFPSMVGRPILRAEEDVGTVELKDVMCGDEANAVRHSLDIRYPVRSVFIDLEALGCFEFLFRDYANLLTSR